MKEIINVENVVKSFKTYETRGRGFVASLRRKYYRKRALNGVSFSIKEGELVALLGRNGSGKSTLIKTLIGILFPDSGTVRVLGLDPWRERVKLASNIGVVLGAHGQLYWDLPAEDTFDLMRHIYHIPDRAFSRRLSYFIDALDLKGVYKRQVRVLSLGEQMKCNFVASVLHTPKLVFLDEPTIGVDLPSKYALRSTILSMQKSFNTTFVITTHIVEDISMAQRAIILDKGRVIFDDTREKLEVLFGDKRHLDIDVADGNKINYKAYGRVLSRSGSHIRLEVERKLTKSKRLMRLLGSDRVLDYKMSEPGLSYIITKLYKLADREG